MDKEKRPPPALLSGFRKDAATGSSSTLSLMTPMSPELDGAKTAPAVKVNLHSPESVMVMLPFHGSSTVESTAGGEFRTQANLLSVLAYLLTSELEC